MLVLIILGTLVAAFILLLCIPVDMDFAAQTCERPRFRVRYRWLFGALNREITGVGKGRARKPAKKSRKRRRIDIRLMLRIIKKRGLASRFIRLVKGLISRLGFRELETDITVGLGDPADTGMLFAFIGPAAGWLGASRFHSLRIEPSFTDEVVFRGSFRGTLRLRPVSLFPPVMKFIFSIPVLKVAGKLIARKLHKS